MSKDYFHRVHRLTPTKFWINNPTRAEAATAIAAGALGCTNNPSYTGKMLAHPEEGPYAGKILDQAIRDSRTDDEAAAIFQRRLVAPVAEAFLPMWKASHGTDGWVSIQGDPVHEDDPKVIIDEARDNRKVSPNICVKIPTTEAGLEAMEVLIAEETPINATEIMSVAQGVALCETYNRISRKTGKKPPLYLSYIAGIYDDHLRNQVKAQGIQIDRDILNQAGLAGARKMYDIMRERDYPAVMIGGGARALRHFTEMVGGALVVTINWVGTADKLIEEDPDVVFRFLNPVPQTVVDELLRKLPDFRRGWEPEGLSVKEFEHFGPVVLFRDSFLQNWNKVLEAVRERRPNLK